MVNFILEKNAEHNSLCYIQKGDTKIYLTEKEAEELLRKMFENRTDIFEEFDPNGYKEEVEELKEEVSDLREVLEEKTDTIRYLESILDEENIDYDD